LTSSDAKVEAEEELPLEKLDILEDKELLCELSEELLSEELLNKELEDKELIEDIEELLI
jgi:hypothetical protein